MLAELSSTTWRKTQGGLVLHVYCESGRHLTIPACHTVFVPIGYYCGGESIDPDTVEFESYRAALGLYRGQRIIVDAVVEVVSDVSRMQPTHNGC
jgi:hypothetical protein